MGLVDLPAVNAQSGGAISVVFIGLVAGALRPVGDCWMRGRRRGAGEASQHRLLLLQRRDDARLDGVCHCPQLGRNPGSAVDRGLSQLLRLMCLSPRAERERACGYIWVHSGTFGYICSFFGVYLGTSGKKMLGGAARACSFGCLVARVRMSSEILFLWVSMSDFVTSTFRVESFLSTKTKTFCRAPTKHSAGVPCFAVRGR